jgi:hypothetical protein
MPHEERVDEGHIAATAVETVPVPELVQGPDAPAAVALLRVVQVPLEGHHLLAQRAAMEELQVALLRVQLALP